MLSTVIITLHVFFFFFLKPSAKALAEDLFYFFVAQHKEQILDK